MVQIDGVWIHHMIGRFLLLDDLYKSILNLSSPALIQVTHNHFSIILSCIKYVSHAGRIPWTWDSSHQGGQEEGK